MATSCTSSFYSAGWSSGGDTDDGSTTDMDTSADDDSGSEEDCFLTANLKGNSM